MADSDEAGRQQDHEFRVEGRPIVLSREPSDSEILGAVEQWIELMARDDYASAVAAVFRPPLPTPKSLRENVECFCIGLSELRQDVVDALVSQGLVESAPPPQEIPSERAHVVRASPRLRQTAEVVRDGIPCRAVAWVGFFVPLDNGFEIWTTIGVFPAGDRCVLELEMFHL